MNFTFLKSSGSVAFYRSDAEQAEWTQHEFSLFCTFPYDPKKVIQRGMIVLFQDPATEAYQAYEIRNCSDYAIDGYQQFTAEDLAVSELTDCHIPDEIQFTDVSAKQAMSRILSGTGWSIGTNESTEISSGDIGRGSVWQGICDIRNNWNCIILPRVTINASGISKKYIDIFKASGTWRGIRLAVNKNFLDPCVIYDDSELYTALYAYGASYSEGTGDKRVTKETLIDSVSWSKTSSHPAKPKGQKYIEDPTKTALYGRNGKPRFGYYQNGSIKDPQILLEKAWESLKGCFEPKISISGTLIDLKRLGYVDEPIRIYDLAIVEIEPLGVQFYKQIIQLTVDLLSPDKTIPNIGDYIPNIIYINRETEDHATGGGGGRGGGTRSTKKQGEFETDIRQNERNIDLNAKQIDSHGNILRQAGMYIDPISGVLIYAEDNALNIGSMFKVQSHQIEMEVSERKAEGANLRSKITQTANQISLIVDESTGKIKASSIVLAINGGQSTIKLSADVIDIDGVVKKLSSYDIGCGQLSAGSILCTDLTCNYGVVFANELQGRNLTVSAGNFQYGAYLVDWKSFQYETFTHSNTRQFMYAQNGDTSNPAKITGFILTGYNSHTIYYLGR